MTGVSHEIKCECCDLRTTRIFEHEALDVAQRHLDQFQNHIVALITTTIIPGKKILDSMKNLKGKMAKSAEEYDGQSIVTE